MFVVYNEKTKIIETNGEMYNFTKMRISVKDENTMIMKGVNVESVPLVLKDFMTGTDRKTCMTSFAREFLVKVEVSDCGQVAAEWLKRCEQLIIFATYSVIFHVSFNMCIKCQSIAL